MIRSLVLAAALLGTKALPSFAQEFTAVQTVEKMIATESEDGSVSVEFSSADRVLPGDNLYYQIAYNNGTSDLAEDVNLVMVVPSEVVYSENSVLNESENAIVAFSTDGGRSYAPRGELRVSQNGEERPAVSEDITHIRWTFPEGVASGIEGSVGFRAIVR